MTSRLNTSSALAGPQAGPVADSTAGELPTRLVASDGRGLAAAWTEPPPGVAARAVAVISSATGVPRGFYRGFASFLAARGYAVLSYDYRGIGGSRQGRLRDEPATMRDWALLDMAAALVAAEQRRGPSDGGSAARLPLLLVGHSFGGNMIGFVPGVERAAALLAVGSQVGEPRLYPGAHRLVAELFFRAVIPAAVAATGVLPSWALGGSAAPLPGGVARQWAAWGLRRGWAFADPEMAPHRQASALVVPVHLWNVSDDLSFAPPRAVDALAAQFRNAALGRHTLTPKDAGVASLGHFGVFRRQAGARAWPLLLDRIEAATPSLRPAR
ncbi:MAG: alpha/beta hydrolase [Rubrivivax sp.]|jgi:predicted alpha/beta hydrolase|nr:alpha/beta hydrolase [Rubrivivax sp.]